MTGNAFENIRHLQHLLMHLLQSIHALLQLDILRRKLSLDEIRVIVNRAYPSVDHASMQSSLGSIIFWAYLFFRLPQLLLDILLGPCRKRREGAPKFEESELFSPRNEKRGHT